MTLDDHTHEELRMLRRRAYGPAADIHSDPEALARLEELETAVRDGSADTADVTVHAGTPPASVLPPSARPVVPEDDAVDAAPGSAAVRRPGRTRRWVAALWPVSVVAAIVVGALSYAAAVPLVSRDAEATQVASLPPDPTFEWPAILRPQREGAVAFREFYGLTAVYTEEDFWGTGEGCMIVLVTEKIGPDSTSYDGPILYGCDAGTFPATVQLPVGEDLPAELRERFPVGSGLQFVFAGDRVGVFAAAAE